MVQSSIAQKIRALRGDMNQRQFALKIGYSKSYVALVEKGGQRPSDDFLKAVAAAFEMPSCQLIPEETRPTRSRLRLRNKMKAIHRCFGRRERQPIPGGRMQHVFAEVRWCPEGAALVAALDSLRRPRAFWSAVRTVARELTAPEQGAFLQLLMPDGAMQELHPHEVRFAFPVAEAPGTCHYAIVIEIGQLLITVHAQVSFLPRVDRVRRLDFLISAAYGRIVVHGVVEIDGPTHKGTERADRARESEIALPFLRFHGGEVYRSDFRNSVINWICGHLQAQCAREGVVLTPQTAKEEPKRRAS